jgi:proline iminopeptidase
MICPPVSAWKLTERWSRGELRVVPLAGHALSEPGISGELVRVTNAITHEAEKFGF